jgi:phospholipase/lecithinase/hemolysin
VLVRNLADINVTPFGMTLDAGSRALITAMTQAFNSQLKAGLSTFAGGLPFSLILYDDYAQTTAIAADPARYGYANVTTPSCGPNAFGGDSLVCNASNLIAGDTSKYAFADDVHPTPFGHQQAAAYAMSLMVAAGWQ